MHLLSARIRARPGTIVFDPSDHRRRIACPVPDPNRSSPPYSCLTHGLSGRLALHLIDDPGAEARQVCKRSGPSAG
jgi:hypothetical protein